MTQAGKRLRVLGKPKPPQAGEFSSKVVNEPVVEPKPKSDKKPR
jgi:hypothetical protein